MTYKAQANVVRSPSLAEKLWTGAYNLVRHGDVYFLEAISGGCAAWSWGVMLILPSETFSTSISYSYIDFLPEWFYGIIMLTFGTAQLACVFYALAAYAVTRTDLLALRPVRRRLAYVGIFLWGCITVMLFLGNNYGTGWGTYFIACLFANWCVAWRIALQSPRR